MISTVDINGKIEKLEISNSEDGKDPPRINRIELQQFEEFRKPRIFGIFIILNYYFLIS